MRSNSQAAIEPSPYKTITLYLSTYFVFYVLYNVFQRLVLVDTTNKKSLLKVSSSSPGFCNVQLDKAKSEDEIALVIKTIYLMWNTFLSFLCV